MFVLRKAFASNVNGAAMLALLEPTCRCSHQEDPSSRIEKIGQVLLRRTTRNDKCLLCYQASETMRDEYQRMRAL
ncbi:uncharacterized protein N7459_006922 [Penicillium hispanicum]|uniref:uncharacterized protein n=1 Tax=Penicillium hispanicum TaxID=1080232 RepID=UPI0025407294|nr:uncharacterized protein N7459_006922 [Penicillium hispanicum]KAJ5577958.1 hypothetical protein N7459_006922 [Penicillium hispanicum]